MKVRLITILAAALFCLTSGAQEKSFQSKYLGSVAKRLELDRLDTLSAGFNAIESRNTPLTVIMSKDSVVLHIGYRLFSPILRSEHPSPIYNYIEYAMLDNKYHFTDNPFVYKDLRFVSGDWKAMESVTDSTLFTIDVLQNKLYVVTWQLANGKKIELMFPINYERLSLVNRRELEQNIIRDVRKFSLSATDTLSFDAAELLTTDKGVSYKPGVIYQTPEINDNVYLESVDSTRLSILYSNAYPVETLANLCVVADLMGANDEIDVTFIKNDYTQEEASLRMSDFIGYMRSEGCVPYWGVESVDDQKVEGALFLCNKDKGFNHVLKVEAALQDIGTGNSRVKATAYLLSPTTNSKDLRYQYNGNTTKTAIQ